MNSKCLQLLFNPLRLWGIITSFYLIWCSAYSCSIFQRLCAHSTVGSSLNSLKLSRGEISSQGVIIYAIAVLPFTRAYQAAKSKFTHRTCRNNFEKKQHSANGFTHYDAAFIVPHLQSKELVIQPVLICRLYIINGDETTNLIRTYNW